MARPREHSDQQILQAVRDLMLEGGPRAVTTQAISERSGASTGSIYHRFGSRASMVVELWIRTVGDFQDFLVTAGRDEEPGIQRALATAEAVLDFAVRRPADAKLLTMANRYDLKDGETPMSQRQADALDRLNVPAIRLAEQLSRELYGRATKQTKQVVMFAVYGIPYTAVRELILTKAASAHTARELVRISSKAVLEQGARPD